MNGFDQNMQCWIITEGMAGTENQCLGVAEKLGLTPKIKRVQLREPWKTLSPYLGFEQNWTFESELSPPWPDILLTSGRKSIAASRYVKKMSGGKTFTVQIQDPRVDPGQFDLVAVPAHDPTRGSNVIVTDASPNRLTQDKLDEGRERFKELFQPLPEPRIAVLIGGNSKAYTLTPNVMGQIVHSLQSIQGSLIITASRRTGSENIDILQKGIQGLNAYLWNGHGENPYFGMLAWADYIMVTADSTSMISEAASTGKPVYILPLEGGNKRFEKFHNHLIDKGVARILDGMLEKWTYTPLQDADMIADEIKKRLNRVK